MFRISSFPTVSALLLAIVPFAAMAPQSAQAQGRSVSVMVGGTADLDACQTLSQVRGLKRRGDNFLSVRRGPGSRYGEISRLRNGHRVYSCAANGSWVGIVYGARGGQDCGVSSPIRRRQAYRGSCRSGWVHRNFLTDIAG